LTSRDVGKHLAVNHPRPICPVLEVANLVANVVALDVDGVDGVARDLVLRLPVFHQARRGCGFGLHVPVEQHLVLEQ